MLKYTATKEKAYEKYLPVLLAVACISPAQADTINLDLAGQVDMFHFPTDLSRICKTAHRLRNRAAVTKQG